MREERVKSKITVVGGGLSGVCAAIAAARLGQTVSLIHNRPVLGGNSSSEVRVWVCGATGHGKNRYARETGIMGEMFVENQYRNPDGNPYLWDLVILETVRNEPNIQLFLNTDVHEIEAVGDESDRKIVSVTGWMMGSERRIRFDSDLFLDCTGDGLVGFLAGAEYRVGREASHEYNEAWAPEVADEITLGSTILFYTKDAGHPVNYVPPSFAKDITQTSIPLNRVIRSGDSGCHYWWIEWGGELDTVHENERIRDELWSVIYGIWDYIKNSGQFEAENMTLEWVGALPGKREYRRFIGEYVLNQNDIMAQNPFDDRIAFGGWSIDLHPPQGMYSTESGSKHMHADGIYHIPFRSLYSVNVRNLLFAGRNISATHVAFGTTRVMATCAVMGEAAGTGAALCAAKGVSPKALYLEHRKELQQTMLRQDASIIGIRNEDALDLARKAVLSVSSSLNFLAVEDAHETYSLKQDVGILLPVDPDLNGLELLVDASQSTTIEIELWDCGKAENYVPVNLVMKAEAVVKQGEKQWIPFDICWQPDVPQNGFIIVIANQSVQLHLSRQPFTGILSFERTNVSHVSSNLEDHSLEFPVVTWSMRNLVRKPFCFRSILDTQAFSPDKIVNGYNRPYGGPHLWVSEPLVNGDKPWIELKWHEPIEIGEIHLTLNDDVNEDLINLHHHKTGFAIIPELLKNYKLEAWISEQWVQITEIKNNRKRKQIHRLSEAIETNRIRLGIDATNGSPCAEVIEIRVYK